MFGTVAISRVDRNTRNKNFWFSSQSSVIIFEVTPIYSACSHSNSDVGSECLGSRVMSGVGWSDAIPYLRPSASIAPLILPKCCACSRLLLAFGSFHARVRYRHFTKMTAARKPMNAIANNIRKELLSARSGLHIAYTQTRIPFRHVSCGSDRHNN